MHIVFILIICLSGSIVGLALTAFAVGSGAPLFVRQLNGWSFSPRIGAADIDPYARARLFSEGGLPLASGEGFALQARSDSDGAPLDSSCQYQLASPFPIARYWTVTLVDRSGRLMPNLAERTGFTSSEIVRTHEGLFSIEIGPVPQAGNWLPTGRNTGAFEVILRFYETPLAATATQLDSRTLPTLRKKGCSA